MRNTGTYYVMQWPQCMHLTNDQCMTGTYYVMQWPQCMHLIGD